MMRDDYDKSLFESVVEDDSGRGSSWVRGTHIDTEHELVFFWNVDHVVELTKIEIPAHFLARAASSARSGQCDVVWQDGEECEDYYIEYEISDDGKYSIELFFMNMTPSYDDAFPIFAVEWTSIDGEDEYDMFRVICPHINHFIDSILPFCADFKTFPPSEYFVK